ncbi:metal ABC transporter permease [Diplocloster agilis]|uniref:Metal ABC transporter permease n=1 Tax=Diplocloster agilis TaxID=2850323 RepID=A0A949NHS6_9FIRM|nr:MULTISPECIES: metal ABC transporter permease [Lachnospiraceae]MBU9738753.1 metal ABC transporter permease [Diplocloster agilis]MCU6736233.1 metal ABC transporter permease [Suonthocola fibrivorans]SCJ88148.1 High-affinity zinc uptake system membrane protein znuB [uncultured Clostridium sp.]
MIYELLESVLPFSWVQYDFMKQAFLAILLITPLFGILGTMIVNHKMAFFSDALGHSALTGVAVGVLFGIPDTNLSMLIFAVLFALALNQIKGRNLMATDTVISVFSSFSIAVGLVILAQGGNFSKYSSLLVGDILSITPREILYLVLLLIGTFIFWILCSNQLNSISINRSLAASRGIRVKLIENLFAVCIAVIVMLSIKWVGILIINALLILPAASARNISENMREYHFFSILFSLFSGIVGLIISYYVNTATGPTIVIIASVIFFATYFYSRHGK